MTAFTEHGSAAPRIPFIEPDDVDEWTVRIRAEVRARFAVWRGEHPDVAREGDEWTNAAVEIISAALEEADVRGEPLWTVAHDALFITLDYEEQLGQLRRESRP